MATRKKTGDGIDPKLAKTLMDKLAGDNAFRRAFKQDPHGALESLGWKRPPGHRKAAPIAKIAPKRQIAATRAAIETRLVEGPPFEWPACCDDFSAQ